MRKLIISLIIMGFALSLFGCAPSGQPKDPVNSDEMDTPEIHFVLDNLPLPEGMELGTAQCVLGRRE